jgi:signal transduction histidine kinase
VLFRSGLVRELREHGRIAGLEMAFHTKDGQILHGWINGEQMTLGGRPCLLTVTVDVTARKQAETAREALARALERKNRELENLVYVTSHDLRSPILNIQGFSRRIETNCTELTQLLAAEQVDRGALAALVTGPLPRSLSFILTSVEKMDQLIGGLLRLSRLGRAGLRLEKLEINAMFGEIMQALAFPIQTAGAVVELGALPACRGDAGLVNQLFTNLLDNALKYRDPARPLCVTVSGRTEPHRAVYCVADNGVGIAPEHQEKIWEMFFRADPAGPAGGEGLGLNLVHRIVERHQGEIWVESTVGAGSRFFVALPLADAPEAAENLPQ